MPIRKVRADLYQSSRPGYPSKDVDPPIVRAWIHELLARGVRRIVCLLDAPQLAYYQRVAGGLIQAYRDAGLVVLHHPVPDHQVPAVPVEVRLRIADQLRQDSMSTLIHCSAGIDRTGAVVEGLGTLAPDNAIGRRGDV